uniref:Ion transport domain-containing protein n=1 Tax=Amphimedon queenslandica TaxID=400682 RepID=A0A1X7SFP2_AMPQE
MIVNNWHVIVDAYVRRTSIYSRIYFVIWWVLSETVINGILLGYLIEILSVTTIHLKDVFKDFDKKPRRKKLALVCLFIFVPQDLREMFRGEADYEGLDTFHSWNIFDATYKEKRGEAEN